jgi:CDP-glycerol glycerophosphotransferase
MKIWNIYVDSSRAPRYIKRLATASVWNPLLYPLYVLSGFVPRKANIWVCGIPKKFVWNSKYVFLYANNAKLAGVKVVWISRSREIAEELQKQGYPAYYWLSWQGIVYPLIAKYHIIDASIETINFWLSGGAKVVLIWHGIPLKKIAHDVTKGLSLDVALHKTHGLKNALLRYLLPWRFRGIDYLVATSPVFRDISSSAFQIPNERIFIGGFPKNDLLFHEVPGSEVGADTGILNKFKELKSSEVGKTVLYAPTWRDTGGDSFFEKAEDLRKLDDFLSKHNLFFFLKLHPLAQEKAFRGAHSAEYKSIFFVRPDSDADPLLPLIDILVTDYSGIYFEYLLLDRPVVFFAFDYEKYTSVDRELYFSYEEVAPGPKAKTLEELMEKLKEVSVGKDDWQEQRKKVRDMAYTYQDGNSAKRVCEFLKQLG